MHDRCRILSSILFALAHLPHRIGINGGYADLALMATDQGWLVVWGCVYCWLYSRTKNLWFVIGVHSLANARTMLVAAPDVAEYLPLSQMLGVALASRLGSTTDRYGVFCYNQP